MIPSFSPVNLSVCQSTGFMVLIQERQPYIIQERKVNSVYQEALLREINDASEVMYTS